MQEIFLLYCKHILFLFFLFFYPNISRWEKGILHVFLFLVHFSAGLRTSKRIFRTIRNNFVCACEYYEFDSHVKRKKGVSWCTFSTISFSRWETSESSGYIRFSYRRLIKKNHFYSECKKCGNLQKLEKGNWKSFVHENEMSCESLKKLKFKI